MHPPGAEETNDNPTDVGLTIVFITVYYDNNIKRAKMNFSLARIKSKWKPQNSENWSSTLGRKISFKHPR